MMKLRNWKNSVKAIIFDLDDTIYEETKFVESGFRAVSSYAEKQLGIGKKKFFGALKNSLEKDGRGHTFDIVLKNYNCYNKGLVNKLVRIYRTHKPKIKPSPGVMTTLQILKNKFLLGIITDGMGSVQRNKVKSLNIEKLFDLIVYSDDLGKDNYKPNKYPY